ncbi:MAG: ATP-binding protein [Bacteroidota bacterium]|nr:ATP-binding protein [Bacteroidota bacterium]
MELNYKVQGGNFSNAGYASSQVKKVLKQLNIDSKLIKRIVVALYEAEVNIVAHAYSGDIKVDINAERIDIILTDKGPGIPNIKKAMEIGYSTASAEVREMGFGAGMGLNNIKNNTDTLNIKSKVNKGTIVHIANHF